MPIDNRTNLDRANARNSNSPIHARILDSRSGVDNAADLRVRMGGSEEERAHYVVILVQAGFDNVEARPLGDAIARDLRGRAPRPDRGIPFYDRQSQGLDPVDLARFFIAFGVDPNTAQAAAEMVTQMIAAQQFYQPFYNAIGGQGVVDMTQLERFYANQARGGAPHRAARRPQGRPSAPRARIDAGARAARARVSKKVDEGQSIRDAVALHKAMDGLGTDEATLTRILSGRTNEEISAIKRNYQDMYGTSLEDAIKGDTSGHFEDSLLAMLKGRRDQSGKVDKAAATRDAVALHEAMDGWGTDEAALNRIISGRSPEQLSAIKEAYQQMFDESLEDAIKGDTSGDFEKTLLAQLNRKPTRAKAPQSDTDSEKDAKATRDAVALHEAMDGWGTDEDKLTSILSNRSNDDISRIKKAYQSMYGKSLEDAIKGDTSGNFEKSLLSMLKGGRDESGEVDTAAATRDAVALHEAMDGWGTDEDTLRRIISGRSAPQLKAIKEAYEEMYDGTLEDAIKGDTSGNFEKSLLAQLKRADTAEKPQGTHEIDLAAGTVRPVDLKSELAARRNAGRLQGGMTAGGAPRVDKNKATRDAVALHNMMDGAGTDEKGLIKLLSNRTNREIRAIRSAYEEMFDGSLDDAIRSDTSGNFESTLLSLASGNRDESSVVDQAQATRDAVALNQAIAGLGTDDDKLISLLTRRSKGHLKATAEAYRAMFGESLQDAIEGDTGGWYESALVEQLR